MKFKKIAALFICIAILVCLFPASVNATSSDNNAGRNDFSDVPQNHWAYDQINWMVKNRIVEGDGNGRFNPDKLVSRDEFAKMMVLTLRLKLINPDGSSFLDIKENSWQYKYVETAKPYLTGFKTSEGYYFHPADQAVREDMAVALVKALGFSNETADENVLSTFSDSSSISPNLKKYVAIAVKHELMQGYNQDGKKVFGPQASLNRASAAQLLYTAFKGNEEKITFDEDKVVFDDADTSANTGYVKPKVRAEVVNGKIKVMWDKISSDKFTGYKVVASTGDSTPEYPDNGYFQYITSSSTTYTYIQAGDCYNNGDFGSEFKAGTDYYISVTALYGDKKVAGNVVRMEVPAAVQNSNDELTVPKVRAEIVNGKIKVSWDKITSSKFTGYKVVASISDSTPKYSENGYFQYITDCNTTYTIIQDDDSYNGGDVGRFQSGTSYYFSVTALYGDTKVAGNVIRLEMP